MAFQKGISGNPNGRPKKKSLKPEDVLDILNEVEYKDKDGNPKKGVNPLHELAILAVTARSEKVRQDAAANLSPFVAHKLKTIEHTGATEAPLNIKLVLSEK